MIEPHILRSVHVCPCVHECTSQQIEHALFSPPCEVMDTLLATETASEKLCEASIFKPATAASQTALPWVKRSIPTPTSRPEPGRRRIRYSQRLAEVFATMPEEPSAAAASEAQQLLLARGARLDLRCSCWKEPIASVGATISWWLAARTSTACCSQLGLCAARPASLSMNDTQHCGKCRCRASNATNCPNSSKNI